MKFNSFSRGYVWAVWLLTVGGYLPSVAAQKPPCPKKNGVQQQPFSSFSVDEQPTDEGHVKWLSPTETKIEFTAAEDPDDGDVRAKGWFEEVVTGFLEKGTTFRKILKIGEKILKFIGLEKKYNGILIDKTCTNCQLFVQCKSKRTRTPWMEIEEEGYIVRFTTRAPTWSKLAGSWVCAFKKKVNGKDSPVVWANVYGKPHTDWNNKDERYNGVKYQMNLFYAGDNGITRMDAETGRGLAPSWEWKGTTEPYFA